MSMDGARRAAVVSILSGWLASSIACSPSETIDASLPDAPEPPCAPATDSVDLLFMIDNTGTMAQEQGILSREMRRLVERLSTGNRDGDPEPEVAPIRSLHVGTVTSNMGAGDIPNDEAFPGCGLGTGDDGRLDHGTAGLYACLGDRVTIHSFELGVTDLDAFVATLACAIEVGTSSCTFEQQLEATLKALSPASVADFVADDYAPPTFWGDTMGHAGPGGANDGFLRAESVLGVVMFTDEEDCSLLDYRIMGLNDSAYAGHPLHLRCSRFPEAQYPPARYVDGFLQLRAYPSRLVYATLAGIPLDLSGAAPDVVLVDPRMQYTEDPYTTPPVRLVTSCDTANGPAYPPRRMVEVAAGIEEGGGRITLQSLCGDSYDSAIDAIIAQLDAAMAGTCE